jgi:hypothetical protein
MIEYSHLIHSLNRLEFTSILFCSLDDRHFNDQVWRDASLEIVHVYIVRQPSTCWKGRRRDMFLRFKRNIEEIARGCYINDRTRDAPVAPSEVYTRHFPASGNKSRAAGRCSARIGFAALSLEPNETLEWSGGWYDMGIYTSCVVSYDRTAMELFGKNNRVIWGPGGCTADYRGESRDFHAKDNKNMRTGLNSKNWIELTVLRVCCSLCIYCVWYRIYYGTVLTEGTENHRQSTIYYTAISWSVLFKYPTGHVYISLVTLEYHTYFVIITCTMQNTRCYILLPWKMPESVDSTVFFGFWLFQRFVHFFRMALKIF